jgi:hypothetical protein
MPPKTRKTRPSGVTVTMTKSGYRMKAFGPNAPDLRYRMNPAEPTTDPHAQSRMNDTIHMSTDWGVLISPQSGTPGSSPQHRHAQVCSSLPHDPLDLARARN